MLAIHFGTSVSQNALRWRQLLPSAPAFALRPRRLATHSARHRSQKWLDAAIGCLASRLHLRSCADSDDTPGSPGYSGLLAPRFALLCSSNAKERPWQSGMPMHVGKEISRTRRPP